MWILVVEMTALWIVLGVTVATVLVWRLRLASARLDLIVREGALGSEAERLPATHDR